MMSRQEFFNCAAATWDQRFQNQELTEFLSQLVPTCSLKPGQQVLDVGSGTGILISFLLRAVGSAGHVTSVDYAEKMVDVCRFKYAHEPNVSFAVQRVEKLDFPSASFDAVTCFGLFPHLENKEVALRQLNRVLKPGGKLIVAHALSSAEINMHHRNVPVVAHDTLPDEEEMRRLLRQAGFVGVSIADEPGRYVCMSIKP